MADFTARSLTEHITEILRDALVAQNGFVTSGGGVYMGSSGVVDVAALALAAEEHYRPRIETPEQLDALPFLTVIREVFRQSPSGTDYGGIYERRTSGWQSLAGTWVEPGRNGAPKLPVIVLWSPGGAE